MAVNTQSQTIELKQTEVTTPMMFYTPTGLIWGDIVHHESILATRILTGITIPEYITVYDAHIMFAQVNHIAKPVKRKEVYLPAKQINMYHLTPPQEDQIDYDPTEPNRVMSPVNIFVPPFSVKGNMRISEITTVKSTLEVLKSDFITFYNLEITHTNNPNMKPIRPNMAFIRSKEALYSLA